MSPLWRAGLLAAFITAIAGLRLLWDPGLVGTPGAEVYGHVWVQWWHGMALPSWPAGTDLAVGADPWPVIDPLPTLLIATGGRLLGTIASHNLWALLSIPLSFAGGWMLAARVNGHRWVGAITLAMWPPLMGARASGLTEDLSIGLAAMALAHLGRPGWAAGLKTGLLLGALAWCGLLNAWFAALTAVGLGLVIAIGDRRSWGSLALAALTAAVVVAPLVAMHGDRLLGVGHRSGLFAPQEEPLWRLNPWRAVDVLSLFTPGFQDPQGALIRMHPGYLGLSTLLLAIRGGWSRWWVVLLGAAAISLGPTFSIAGHPTDVANPVTTALQWIPGGSLLNHHGRALLMGGVAMAALTARGARAFHGRQAWIVGAVVACDLAFLSPLPLPLPVAPATPPDVVFLLDDLPPGPMLVLPAGGPGVHFQRPLLDQRIHHRPLLLSPNRPGLPAAMMDTDTGRWLASLAFEHSHPPPDVPAFPTNLTLIMSLPAYTETLSAGLGAPTRTGADGSAVWVVTAERNLR